MASEVKVIRQFFGQKPGQPLQEFADELKQLSTEEKRYLAEGAAKELGVELDAPLAKAA